MVGGDGALLREKETRLKIYNGLINSLKSAMVIVMSTIRVVGLINGWSAGHPRTCCVI